MKDLQVAVAVGLAQGGQASAPAWKMVADVLLKVQERIEDIPMDKYLQKKYRFEGSHNGVIRIPTVDGELWDLHAAMLADDLSPIAGSRTLFQHRLEQSQILPVMQPRFVESSRNA